MAHLGEQAITAERQHDHADRLLDGGPYADLNDADLAVVIRGIAGRIFEGDHRNARALREAARRLEQ